MKPIIYCEKENLHFSFRSELYGGSGARLSHGANGVKSAESVLRLIESNASGSDRLIPSSSSSIRVSSYVASSTTDTIQHSHHHLPAVLSGRYGFLFYCKLFHTF